MKKPKKLPSVFVLLGADGIGRAYASHLRDAISNLKIFTRYVPATPAKVCRWEWIDQGRPFGYYKTFCDNVHEEDYGPYCHSCGGKIKWVTK